MFIVQNKTTQKTKLEQKVILTQKGAKVGI